MDTTTISRYFSREALGKSALHRIRTPVRAILEWLVSPVGVRAWSMLLPGLVRLLGRVPLVDLTQVRRLGILRLDGMGDLVMMSGMLRELRRQLPNARITLICKKSWAGWMRTCPWIDEVIEFELSLPARFYEQKRMLEMLRFARKELWPRELEVLIEPGTHFWYLPTRALALFSGAPVRICWADPESAEDSVRGFHTRVLPYSNELHETEKCARMLGAIGLKSEGRRFHPWWTPEEGVLGMALSRRAIGGRKRLIALGLGASEYLKRWPRESFLELIRQTAILHEVSFIAFGGSDVAETCQWLSEQASGKVTYAGNETSLGLVWAAMSHCHLYVGNDTGLMHMASAAAIPVVAIIGLPEAAKPGTRGSPSNTGPSETQFRVIRPPLETPAGPGVDGGLDARLVTVADVVFAVHQLLDEGITHDN